MDSGCRGLRLKTTYGKYYHNAEKQQKYNKINK